MPRGDGTGPMGLGPMTGRAAGYCAGFATPGYLNPIGGRLGRGMGWGRGRGRHWWPRQLYPYHGALPYAQTPYEAVPFMTSEQETEMLKQHAKVLEDQLKDIQKRVSELEEEASEIKR